MSTLELENIKHPDNSGNNIELNSNGSMVVDRQSTDGTITEFRKSGTTVGSIGIQSSGFYIDGESGHEGLRFANGTVTPRENGADSNGSSDLGASNNRWKDLYLSGGVYLGGTGSTNKLDDYEEGTWTPQLSSDVSITSYTILNGYYTKVGRLVTVSATVQAASLGSWSGAIIALYGLPFTVSNDSNNEAVGTLAMRGATGDKDGLYIRFIQNGTYMRLEHRTGYQSHDPNMPANTIDTGTKIYVTGSYFVA